MCMVLVDISSWHILAAASADWTWVAWVVQPLQWCWPDNPKEMQSAHIPLRRYIPKVWIPGTDVHHVIFFGTRASTRSVLWHRMPILLVPSSCTDVYKYEQNCMSKGIMVNSNEERFASCTMLYPMATICKIIANGKRGGCCCSLWCNVLYYDLLPYASASSQKQGNVSEP